jgi:ADP-ribosylglycohydrolase
MRSAIIGVCYGDDPQRLKKLVAISTKITHTDPKAEWAALSVAIAAQQSMRERCSPGLYYSTLESAIGSEGAEFLGIVKRAAESADRGDSTPEFAAQCGFKRGPGGYCLQSVPVALHAWFRNPTDIRSAVTEAIRCGGDTDTMAAIVGGIIGARVGPAEIPQSWIDGLVDWPLTSRRLVEHGELLATVVSSGAPCTPRTLPYAPSVLRNLCFAMIILAHGLRRLAPPY